MNKKKNVPDFIVFAIQAGASSRQFEINRFTTLKKQERILFTFYFNTYQSACVSDPAVTYTNHAHILVIVNKIRYGL